VRTVDLAIIGAGDACAAENTIEAWERQHVVQQ
jgi:hypothetical protein